MSKALLNPHGFKSSFEDKLVTTRNESLSRTPRISIGDDSPTGSIESDAFDFVHDKPISPYKDFGFKFKGEDSFQIEHISIFKELIPESQFRDNTECNICKINKFCGYAVCPNDSTRRRPDPKKPDVNEYHRICDKCNDSYINQVLENEFTIQYNALIKKIENIESLINNEENRCKSNQSIYDDFIDQKARKDREYTDLVNNLTQEISETKERIKKLDKENSNLNQEFSGNQKDLATLQDNYDEIQKEYETKQEDLKNCSSRIDNFDKEISSINKKISEYEGSSNSKKYNKTTNQMCMNSTPSNSDSLTSTASNLKNTRRDSSINFSPPYNQDISDYFNQSITLRRHTEARNIIKDARADKPPICTGMKSCNIF